MGRGDAYCEWVGATLVARGDDGRLKPPLPIYRQRLPNIEDKRLCVLEKGANTRSFRFVRNDCMSILSSSLAFNQRRCRNDTKTVC